MIAAAHWEYAIMESMIASTQYELSPQELAVVLALARAATLADAGLQLGVNASTVFRTVQRLEKALGQRLFERARTGYSPTELALRLARHAELIESELVLARAAFAAPGEQLAGTVRISAVDAVLRSLVVPALTSIRAAHPQLRIELQASNDLASLTHREADIALRSTNRPPQHLIAKSLGRIRFAVYAAGAMAGALPRDGSDLMSALAAMPWIAVDEAMPEHPGVAWRKRNFPRVRPVFQANSMLTVVQLIEAGLGVGVVADFHARQHRALVALTEALDNCEIGLWLLTHPESRHLRRIAEVSGHIQNWLAREP